MNAGRLQIRVGSRRTDTPPGRRVRPIRPQNVSHSYASRGDRSIELLSVFSQINTCSTHLRATIPARGDPESDPEAATEIMPESQGRRGGARDVHHALVTERSRNRREGCDQAIARPGRASEGAKVRTVGQPTIGSPSRARR